MKTNIILWLLFSCAIISFAQNRVVLKPSGEIISASESTTSLDIKSEKKERKRNSPNSFEPVSTTKGTNGAVDTMSYFRDFNANTNFGIFGQDWVLQWFVAPADMIIYSAGISIAEIPATNVELEVKLVRLKWSKTEINSVGIKRLGFYKADSNMYNNITAFQDNRDRTGDWTDASGLGLTSPFAEDIWSDSGKGVVINPILKTAERQYQWIKLDTLGESPVVQAGTIIGVAVRNLSPSTDSIRVGIAAGIVTGSNGFKFYNNGRLQPGNDFGWWSREYTFDFALEVEMGEGCAFYFHPNITKLATTLSTEPREVSAEIIHCEFQDIEKSKVELVYSFDKGVSYTKVQMTTTDSANYFQTFKGTIPGAQPGTQVYYYVLYTQADGNQMMSRTISYYIFKIENPSLLVFNGFMQPTGYPQSYYFGHNGATTTASELINFPKDNWAYGELTKELVDYYTNIFEITTTGPKAINNDIIKEWLAASPTHNYLLAGDEYLGYITTWRDSTYAAGDFQYDVLGISADHNDINYDTTGDEKKVSLAAAVAGTELGDSLYLKVLALNEDSLKIDPVFEFGSSFSNWLDGFETTEGTIVDVTAKGINGNSFNVGAHRTLPAGNKIVFLAFDPLSLDSPELNYFWYGFDRVSPLVQTMRWFGADVVDVENEISSPLYFQLNQNYPNPFNPNTVISWQLAVGGHVSLKVYDILGNEVAVLVNEEKLAGDYKTTFNTQLASGISSKGGYASGVYFYTLRAGSFVQSRKMILLK